MSATVWTKFFWSDWDTDKGLRQCSLAAQGLWMRMLCICANGEPHGYLTIAGQPLGPKDVAQSVGVPEGEVVALMAELDRWGVYSVDAKGRIYSRRMVGDAQKRKILQKNGKKGGNPSLCNSKEKNHLVNQAVKPPDKPHKPEARSQEEVVGPPADDDPIVFQHGRVKPLTKTQCLKLWREYCPSKSEPQFFAMLRKKAEEIGPQLDFWAVEGWLAANKRWAAQQTHAMTGG